MIPESLNLDTLGRFSVAKIDGKRVRVFATTDRAGRLCIGASKRFSRIEAYRNAVKVSTVTPLPGETALAALLRSKGFPVTDMSVVDDTTADLIGQHINQWLA